MRRCGGPMYETMTASEAIAWIATCDPAFAEACRNEDWLGTCVALSARRTYDRIETDLTAEDAKTRLEKACRDGTVKSYGIRGTPAGKVDTEQASIPSSEWRWLGLGEREGAATASGWRDDSLLSWLNPMFCREDVLRGFGEASRKEVAPGPEGNDAPPKPARTTENVSPVPPKVFGDEELAIDKAIRDRYDGSAPTIRAEVRSCAIPFGRRALATAIRAAHGAQEDNLPRSKWDGQWERLAGQAHRAKKAIHAVLHALDPSAQHYVKPLLQTRLGAGIRIDGEFREQGHRDVATLLEAKAIAERLEQDATRRRRVFTAAIGHPALTEKRPFVEILAEAWVFLVGRRPGANPTPEKNPFLRFVQAAWSDWKGDEADPQSFVKALRDVIPKLDDDRVAILVRDGPEWGGITEPVPDFLWGS
jgi:hypothetical protein